MLGSSPRASNFTTISGAGVIGLRRSGARKGRDTPKDAPARSYTSIMANEDAVL